MSWSHKDISTVGGLVHIANSLPCWFWDVPDFLNDGAAGMLRRADDDTKIAARHRLMCLTDWGAQEGWASDWRRVLKPSLPVALLAMTLR